MAGTLREELASLKIDRPDPFSRKNGHRPRSGRRGGGGLRLLSWFLWLIPVCLLAGAGAFAYRKYDQIRSRPQVTVALVQRMTTGEAAKHYNVLQKMTYVVVVFVLLPAIVLMGWAMSPYLNSLLPGWVDIVGGRQSARTIHFLIAFLLLAFVGVHVFEVIVTGLWNNLRSMITGRYDVTVEEKAP